MGIRMNHIGKIFCKSDNFYYSKGVWIINVDSAWFCLMDDEKGRGLGHLPALPDGPGDEQAQGGQDSKGNGHARPAGEERPGHRAEQGGEVAEEGVPGHPHGAVFKG